MAETAGIYVFLLIFADQRITRTANLALNDEIMIPGAFNETYHYEVMITDPNGDPVTLDDCDNFVFDTFLNLTPEDCGDLCNDN